MIISELFALLGLDLDAQSFAKGQLAVEGIKLAVRGFVDLVGSAARAIPNMVEETAHAADHLDELSQSTGVNAQALQELGYAAGFSSIGTEELAQSLGFMAKNAQAALDGNEQTAEAFGKLGVSARDLRDSSPDELLMQIADAFSAMPEGMAKTALAMDLFGRSGKQLIPFLNEGADGIGKLRREANDLGVVLDETTVKAGAGLEDAMDRVKASLTGLKYEVIGPLIPDIKSMAEQFLGWVRANHELIKQRLEKVLDAVRIVGGALLKTVLALNRAVGWAIDHWKLLAIIIGSYLVADLVVASGGFAGLATSALFAGGAMVVAAYDAAAAWLAATWPVIAIAALLALVVLIAEDIYVALTGGESLIGNLMEKWAEWLDHWLNDNSADTPWWLLAIKGFIYEITHLDEVWDEAVAYWRDVFKKFFDWVDQKAHELNNAINPFAIDDNSSSGVRGATVDDPEFAAKLRAAHAIATENPATVASRFGGGASPEAAAAASAGGARPGNVISNTIHVEAKTKADAEEIGKHLEGVLEDWWDGKMGAALAAHGG